MEELRVLTNLLWTFIFLKGQAFTGAWNVFNLISLEHGALQGAESDWVNEADED